MKKFMLLTIFVLSMIVLRSQTIAVQAPDNRISVISSPRIDFTGQTIATYNYSYYQVGGSFQNQYSTYNFRASLVTPGPGRYVIYTFVNVYARSNPIDQSSALVRIVMYKYITHVTLR